LRAGARIAKVVAGFVLVRAKAGRQVLMHIRPPLSVSTLESDHGESGSVHSGIHFRRVNWPRTE